MKQWIWFPMVTLLMFVSLAGCSTATPSSKPAAPSAATPSTLNSQEAQQLSLEVNEPADESVVTTGSVSLSGTVSTAAEITVNGISVAVEGGNFTAMVELEEGPNSLEIRATDAKGHEETKVLTIVYLP